MSESKTVNFHRVLEGKKQQFHKISLQTQSAQRLLAIPLCCSPPTPPPPTTTHTHTSCLCASHLYSLGFQNVKRYEPCCRRSARADNCCKLAAIVSACIPGRSTCIASLPLQLLLFLKRAAGTNQQPPSAPKVNLQQASFAQQRLLEGWNVHSSIRGQSVNAVISPPEGLHVVRVIMWPSKVLCTCFFVFVLFVSIQRKETLKQRASVF